MCVRVLVCFAHAVSQPNADGSTSSSSSEDRARRLAYKIEGQWHQLTQIHSALTYLKGAFDVGALEHATEVTVPALYVS